MLRLLSAAAPLLRYAVIYSWRKFHRVNAPITNVFVRSSNFIHSMLMTHEYCIAFYMPTMTVKYVCNLLFLHSELMCSLNRPENELKGVSAARQRLQTSSKLRPSSLLLFNGSTVSATHDSYVILIVNKSTKTNPKLSNVPPLFRI